MVKVMFIINIGVNQFSSRTKDEISCFDRVPGANFPSDARLKSCSIITCILVFHRSPNTHWGSAWLPGVYLSTVEVHIGHLQLAGERRDSHGGHATDSLSRFPHQGRDLLKKTCHF